MKNRVCVFILIFLILNVQLFAKGKAEETEIVTQNDEWILCITDFDVSSLPAEKLAVAGVITRKIAERIDSINYRTRISPEYAYYESFAWSRSRSAAAKALASKMDERSQLIYKGEPNWRYRQNIKRIDEEIVKLRETLEEAESSAPLINSEPVFKLTDGNIEFSFSAAPQAGSEKLFCNSQTADGFIKGAVTDFHGRYYLSIKLYTLYTGSYVWEDGIVFTHDDLENALDDITRRLLIVLSGNQPAAVAITAEPNETLVLINRSFAGRGGTDIMEFSPGTIIVTASAPDYESVTFETDLSSGELANISINLTPVEYGEVEITGDLSGYVYQGALYIGESPLTLRLPYNQMEYFELETVNKWKGSAVFQTPESPEITQLSLRILPPLKEGRVDRVRRQYYWSWGAAWITGIAAWISYHSFKSSNEAIRYNYAQTQNFDRKFADENMKMYDFYTGAGVAVGIAAAVSIIQMIRYLYISNQGSTPVARTGGNK